MDSQINCNCGVFITEGRVLSKGELPKIPIKSLSQISADIEIFEVKPNTIYVTNLSKLYCKHITNLIFELRCENCHCSFMFMKALEEKLGYVYEIIEDPSTIERRRSDPVILRPLSKYFPVNLKPFIRLTENREFVGKISQTSSDFSKYMVIGNENHDFFEGDPDFELMFSGRNENDFGSFRSFSFHNDL